jgi:hypothetical protein
MPTWLTPEESSDYLWKNYRLKRNARRLGQLRAAGEGPKYFRDGNVVRYREDLLDQWAEHQLGEPVTSTSEESARRLLTVTEQRTDHAVQERTATPTRAARRLRNERPTSEGTPHV